MDNDLSFAQNRLNQLTEQLLAETPITGDIVFFADEDAGGISGATWRFEEEDQAFLKECGFRFMLMELLNILIKHRAREGDAPLNGIVHLENSVPEISWLCRGEAEDRRSAS